MTRTPKIPDAALARVPGRALYRMAQAGADIEIGGEHPTLVLPDVVARKWGGECWLRVSHADAQAMKASDKAKERTKAGKKVLEIPCSAKRRRHEIREGSLQWDVIYEAASALPADGIERFQLAFPEGLTWYFQPELTPEEVAEGAERPENVVGSYAGYFHKSGRFLDADGNEIANYETGKFAHLYRPEMVDAAGNRAWATQELVGNELRVTLPTEWIDTAIYPVTLDPTFGYDTKGASVHYTTGSAKRYGSMFTAPGSGRLSTMHAHWSNNNASIDRKIALGIYSQPTGSTPIAGEVEGSFVPFGEYLESFDLSGDEFDFVETSDYWFAWQGYDTVNSSNTNTGVFYDSWSQNNKFSNFNRPWSSLPSTSANTYRYSIYATYTESGGLTAPTLTAPANTVTGVALRPNFTWS